jgi:hypothetical protein
MISTLLLACTTATEPLPAPPEEGPPSTIVVILGGLDAARLAEDSTPAPWLSALPGHRETQVSGALPDWGSLAASRQTQGVTTLGLSNDPAVPLGEGFDHVENQPTQSVRDLVNTLRGWDARVEGPTFTVLAIGDLRSDSTQSLESVLYVDQYVARLGEAQEWGDARHALVVSDPSAQDAARLWIHAGPGVQSGTGSDPADAAEIVLSVPGVGALAD